LTLPIVGPFIRGGKNALELAQWLQPQVMLPTAAGGDVKFIGFLTKFLQTKGSIEEFRSLLAKNNLSTQVIEAKSGDRIELQLQKKGVEV
jgi:L-ascorbate metabolism protein UlaG (beta-lactamase superfamily)